MVGEGCSLSTQYRPCRPRTRTPKCSTPRHRMLPARPSVGPSVRVRPAGPTPLITNYTSGDACELKLGGRSVDRAILVRGGQRGTSSAQPRWLASWYLDAACATILSRYMLRVTRWCRGLILCISSSVSVTGSGGNRLCFHRLCYPHRFSHHTHMVCTTGTPLVGLRYSPHCRTLQSTQHPWCHRAVTRASWKV